MGEKKYYKLKSLVHRKVYTESYIRHYSSNMVKFIKLKHFVSKSRDNSHFKRI